MYHTLKVQSASIYIYMTQVFKYCGKMSDNGFENVENRHFFSVKSAHLKVFLSSETQENARSTAYKPGEASKPLRWRSNMISVSRHDGMIFTSCLTETGQPTMLIHFWHSEWKDDDW